MRSIGCKMCGGNLVITKDRSIARCEHCGRIQTIPQADDEKKLMLFDRANTARQKGEFDKAAGIYESIVANDPAEPEAYWGLVLCRYGVEYVDDPTTGEKIPTCHRSSFQSVLQNADFAQACAKADPIARRVYQAEGETLEQLREQILEISGKEDPYDIFICYKESDAGGNRTPDSLIAQELHDVLIRAGYRTFFARISLESVPGIAYEPYIFAALTSAKVMLVVGTDPRCFQSVWVKNEWSRFLALRGAGQKKDLIPCYKGIRPEDLPPEFRPLQAQDMGKVGAKEDLLRGIDKIFAKLRPESTAASFSKTESGSLENILQLGFLDLKGGCREDAEKTFRLALQVDSGCPGALLGLLLCAEEPRRYLEQLFSCSAGISEAEKPWITPDNCEALLQLFIRENRDGDCNSRIGWIFGQFRAENHAWKIPPLFFAIEAGNPASVQCLLEHGADPLECVSKPFSGGQAIWPMLSRAISLQSPAMVKLLLEHGADAEACCVCGDAYGTSRTTALQHAACLGNPEILRLLASYNAQDDGTPREFFGKTADERIPLLSDAVLCQSDSADEAVRTLLELGADPDSCRLYKDKKTGRPSRIHALHDAVRTGNPERTKLLLQAGANPCAVSNIYEDGHLTQRTPLAEAILYGLQDTETARKLIALLINYGAGWEDEITLGGLHTDVMHYPFDLEYGPLDREFAHFLRQMGWTGDSVRRIGKYVRCAVMLPIYLVIAVFECIFES